MKTIAIVIPTYNEKENIENITKSIENIYNKIKNKVNIKILIVDDNSPDGTGIIADNLTKIYKNFNVLHRTQKNGLGMAYIDGLKYAINNLKTDYVLTMDCDLSHSPSYIPDFIEHLDNYDLIIGSRYIKGGGTYKWPLYRRIISSGANTLAKIFLGIKSNDCTSGFRVYSKEALNKIKFENIQSNGYSFLIEILYRCFKEGLKVHEIPFVFIDRSLGKTKMSKKEIFKTLSTLIRLKIRGYDNG